jgi:hypothetical protein
MHDPELRYGFNPLSGKWFGKVQMGEYFNVDMMSFNPLSGKWFGKVLMGDPSVRTVLTFQSPLGEVVWERVRLQTLTQRAFQTPNRRTKFCLSINGRSFATSSRSRSLNPLLEWQSTHLNGKIRV